jgi:hypothetical protein
MLPNYLNTEFKNYLIQMATLHKICNHFKLTAMIQRLTVTVPPKAETLFYYDY